MSQVTLHTKLMKGNTKVIILVACKWQRHLNSLEVLKLCKWRNHVIYRVATTLICTKAYGRGVDSKRMFWNVLSNQVLRSLQFYLIRHLELINQLHYWSTLKNVIRNNLETLKSIERMFHITQFPSAIGWRKKKYQL